MESAESSALLECPECKQHLLMFDNVYKLYNCTNEACKLSFSEKDLAKTMDSAPESEAIKKAKPRKAKKIKYRQVGDKPFLAKVLIFPFKVIWGLIKLIFWWMD
jgi:hypothetical protein